MTQVSLRVTEQEKKWMESYAKVNGVSLSEAIKNALFEKLEDEYDLKVIREYEQSPPERVYSLEEVKRELGFSDEV